MSIFIYHRTARVNLHLVCNLHKRLAVVVSVAGVISIWPYLLFCKHYTLKNKVQLKDTQRAPCPMNLHN